MNSCIGTGLGSAALLGYQLLDFNDAPSAPGFTLYLEAGGARVLFF